MMWHDSPLQSFSKEFDLRGYPPIGVFTFFDRPASHRLPVASMHCMYQCMYMFTNKVGNAKKVSAANAWREIQSRYSTWLESHIIYSTSQQDGTYKMRVECLVFSIVVWILLLAVIRYFPQPFQACLLLLRLQGASVRLWRQGEEGGAWFLSKPSMDFPIW